MAERAEKMAVPLTTNLPFSWVVLSNISVPSSTILPEIAPLAQEAVITIPPRGTGDDAWTGMDLVLKAHGIKTVVLVGILANVAVV